MKYKGLQFTNKADKTVEIDIEGYIGFDPYDSKENQVNTKEKMKAELKKLAKLEAEIIIVNINSYGGDVNHGVSIHDLLAEHKAKIITKINGMTASAATIIAMAGDERRMSDNALFLVHNATSWGWGDEYNMKMISKDLNTIDDRIANIYSKVTGKSKDDILILMNDGKGQGKWLTADEAKDLGFITNIFEPLKAVAYFSNDILTKYQLPPLPDSIIINNDNKILDKIEEANSAFLIKLKKFFQINNKSKKQMKQFDAINKVIGIDELKSNDEGVYFNEEQLSLLDAKLTQIDKDTTTLKSAQADLKKAQTDLATANKTIQEQTTELEDFRKNAGAASAKVVSNKETIEEPNKKDSNIFDDDKSFSDNLTAIADEFGINNIKNK